MNGLNLAIPHSSHTNLKYLGKSLPLIKRLNIFLVIFHYSLPSFSNCALENKMCVLSMSMIHDENPYQCAKSTT